MLTRAQRLLKLYNLDLNLFTIWVHFFRLRYTQLSLWQIIIASCFKVTLWSFFRSLLLPKIWVICASLSLWCVLIFRRNDTPFSLSGTTLLQLCWGATNSSTTHKTTQWKWWAFTTANTIYLHHLMWQRLLQLP